MKEIIGAMKKAPTRAYKVALVLDQICGEHAEFSSAEGKIYTLFFLLEKQMPDLFGDFVFEERNVHPFSQEIHSALFDLENAGILAESNPIYSSYSWTSERDKLRVSIHERFDKETIERVRSVASKIAESLKIC